MATNDGSFLTRRVDAASLPLAVGDVLVLLAFLTAGALEHNTVSELTNDPLYLGGVVAPFLLGWAVAAPLIGAYSAGAAESAKASVPLAIRSWIAAAVIGLALRATPIFHGGVEPIFAAVMLVGGSVVLGVWRAVAGRLF